MSANRNSQPLGARGLLLGFVCMAQFLVVLDATVVNVMIPSILNDLGGSPAQLQWVVNGYVIAFGGFLLLGGRLADMVGRRRVLLTGIAVFTLWFAAGRRRSCH